MTAPERHAEIIAERDAGHSQAAAARNLGMPRCTLNQYRIRAGIVWQNKYNREAAQ